MSSFDNIPFYTPDESLKLIMGTWRLIGPNYYVWKMHFRSILRAQEKLYVIDRDPIAQPAADAPDCEHDAYYKYLADESDVMSILVFSVSPRLVGSLKRKTAREFVQELEGKFHDNRVASSRLVMRDILSQQMKDDQFVGDHLINMRRLFNCLVNLEYPATEQELVMLMFKSLSSDYQFLIGDCIVDEDMTVIKLHELIIKVHNSLDFKNQEPLDFDPMELEGWIDEFGDASCPVCGNKDICEHSLDIESMDIDSSTDSGIFMIDCFITSYESWVLDTGCGHHICNHLQGFKRSRKLKQGDVDLRVGEGSVVGAEAVGTYSLSLPSGLVLELENCFYVPRLIKNVISFDLLVDSGFKYNFENKTISCFKNDIYYFSASSQNGLYTLNLQNNKEIYHISKRSKDIADQTYLWHCRLGHIGKKRIEKLLKDEVLEPFAFEAFDNCESCLSGKLTKKPFEGTNERAKELLELIHSDVCGPFSHEARGGYRYFVTFTDDFSRYGYVYLMRHKSETFDKFKEFQNEVQNQLNKKIKLLRSDRGGGYLS